MRTGLISSRSLCFHSHSAVSRWSACQAGLTHAMLVRRRGAGWRHPRTRASRAPTRPVPASTRARRGRVTESMEDHPEQGGSGGTRAASDARSYGFHLTPRRWALEPGRSSRLSALLEDGVGLDVDLRAGELGGEPGVLALLADRERELVVGHERADGLARGVQDEARGDLRRRQRVRDELRELGVVVDDVDLLAAELLGDGADAPAELADAGALGVDRRVVRLAPRSWCGGRPRGRATRSRRVRGDLGHLEREQLADETGVRARDRDLRALACPSTPR